MNKIIPFYFFALGIFIIQSIATHAQHIDQSSPDQPKIGLVLSGGGAKGLAHVGILRYMEKAGIRPDMIVGTSMGSVIGGLYAVGYSADELEALVLKSDWETIVSNRVGFNDISFEEKEYYNRYLLELPIEDKKIGLPTGLIEGQKLSETLHYYTWPVNDIRDFDSLPIPFRCIATDVRNGEEIVIKSGYLQDALRASLAIPTFFTAFDMDSTLAVDGGVVNNFPVDVAKQMGADIVIGVNVSDEDFVDPRELGSFAGILMQIAMSKSYSRLIDNIADCDIYIKPDLNNYSTGSFSKYKEILELGNLAGQKAYPKFQALADSLGIFIPTPGIGLEVEPITISKIDIIGNKLFSNTLILSKLGIREGQEVSRNELRDGISRIFGINGFYIVDYSLAPQGDNSYHLYIRTREKPKNLLFASVHYDNVFSAGIIFNLTMRDVIGKSSRSVVVGDISANPKLRFDYYKYIGGAKKYAFFGRTEFLSQQLPIYDNGQETDIAVNRERNFMANIMSTHSLKETFMVGGFYENNRYSSKFDVRFPQEIKTIIQNFYGMRVMYYRNSLNDRNYATKGAEGIFSINYKIGHNYQLKLEDGVDTIFFHGNGEPNGIPAEQVQQLVRQFEPNGFFTAYAMYYKFYSLSNKFQIMPTISTGLTFSNEDNSKIFDDFVLGGFQRVRFTDIRIWGLNYRELAVPNFANVGTEIQYNPIQNLFFRGGLNYVGYHDHVPISKMNGNFVTDMVENGIFGYGLDVTLKTLFGPITGGVGKNSNDKNVRLYFSIGFSFNYTDR